MHKKLLVISLDALGDLEFDLLKEYPNFNKLMASSVVTRQVNTLFLSNTYPIHTSIVTGVYPETHGIISNVKAFPDFYNHWNIDSRMIKSKTIWEAAHEKGLQTAAVMWPVTGYAKTIRYNIPEAIKRPEENQVIKSLLSGSKWIQIKAYMRYGKKLNGMKQPALDNFAASSMVMIIKEKDPDLMLMHLSCYDSFCHRHGKNYEKLKRALKSLDKNLGKLLAAIDANTSVIVFSDHSQVTLKENINPNHLLEELGFLTMNQEGHIESCQCFFECCGGSAFFHNKELNSDQIDKLKHQLESCYHFHRFLTVQEMKTCGRPALSFGFCAKPGYNYMVSKKKKLGDHGYPVTDYDDYQVFYAQNSRNMKPEIKSGGHILDLTAMICEELDISL